MKKSGLLLAIFTIVIASACQKEISSQENLTKSKIVFSGKTELAVSTKTSIVYDGSQYAVSWVANDRITVIDASGNVDNGFYATDVSGAKCTFVTSTDPGVLESPSTYYAVYPHSIYDSVNSKYVLPEIQTYVSETESKEFPMLAKTTGNSFGFLNICGIIHLGVRTNQANIKVKSITVEDASGDTGLSGDFSVDNWDTAAITISGTKGVTLDCSAANDNQGVEIGSTAHFFSIAVPSVSFVPRITVETMDGLRQTVTASKTVTVARSKYNNFSIYPCEFVWDYEYGTSNTILAYNTTELTVDIVPYCVGTDCLRGNAATKAPTPSSAEVVWYEGSLGKPVISNFVPGESFKVSLPSNTQYGNALVAIKDASGTILWSYHIWKPEQDPTITIPYYNPKEYDVMPFYLGAMGVPANTTVDNGNYSWGNYYQWGRKDPLLRAKGAWKYADCYDANDKIINYSDFASYDTKTILAGREDNTCRIMVDFTESKPNCFVQPSSSTGSWTDIHNSKLWGITKTVYDPCPSGYKVAPVKIYYQFGTNKAYRIFSDEYLNTTSTSVSANNGFWVYTYGTKNDDPLPDTKDYYSATGIATGYLTSRICLLASNGGFNVTDGCYMIFGAGSPLTFTGSGNQGNMLRCVKE